METNQERLALLSKPIVQQRYTTLFSICTLVTDWHEYSGMLQSFLDRGFDADTCEYLHVDNSQSNCMDAYQGINCFLRQAKGEFVIICHQDVVLQHDDIAVLKSKLRHLESLDPGWAVCGNAGASGPNDIVYHISYPSGLFMNKGRFPQKVTGLDENFMVVKNGAMLSVSTDLRGFHLYGVDLCLHAAMEGRSCYVIDFNLLHKSRGNVDDHYRKIRGNLIRKYNTFFRTRWIQTTTTVFHLSGCWLGRWLSGNPISLFAVRMYNGLRKRLR